MEFLKKIFPRSFSHSSTLGKTIITAIIYILVGAVAGVAIGILAHIPVVNLLTGILGGLVDLYCVAGIVISILVYLKVIK